MQWIYLLQHQHLATKELKSFAHAFEKQTWLWPNRSCSSSLYWESVPLSSSQRLVKKDFNDLCRILICWNWVIFHFMQKNVTCDDTICAGACARCWVGTRTISLDIYESTKSAINRCDRTHLQDRVHPPHWKIREFNPKCFRVLFHEHFFANLQLVVRHWGACAHLEQTTAKRLQQHWFRTKLHANPPNQYCRKSLRHSASGWISHPSDCMKLREHDACIWISSH